MAWYDPRDWGVKEFLFGDPQVDIERPELEGGEELRRRAREGLEGVTGREAPQAGRTQIGEVERFQEQGPFRQQQIELAQRLGRISRGEEAGAGELAARRAGTRATAQQIGMARMARGAGAAAAQRGAARGVQDIAVQTAGQAQQAALQDQAAAMAQMAGVLGTGRQADIQVGLANMSAENQRLFQQAGLDQATSLANMQSRLQMMGMNDQAALAYMAQMFNMDLAEMQARLQADQLRVAQRSPGALGDIMQTGGQLGAAAIAASDVRLKTNIKPGQKRIRDFLSSLQPYEYDYKQPKVDGQGRQLGVMAQDLEHTNMGKALVRNTARGKMIDYGKGFSTMMASIVDLNNRINDLEKDPE